MIINKLACGKRVEKGVHRSWKKRFHSILEGHNDKIYREEYLHGNGYEDLGLFCYHGLDIHGGRNRRREGEGKNESRDLFAR
jgi:hypothetical protein